MPGMNMPMPAAPSAGQNNTMPGMNMAPEAPAASQNTMPSMNMPMPQSPNTSQ
jgi:hypothetical protein